LGGARPIIWAPPPLMTLRIHATPRHNDRFCRGGSAPGGAMSLLELVAADRGVIAASRPGSRRLLHSIGTVYTPDSPPGAGW